MNNKVTDFQIAESMFQTLPALPETVSIFFADELEEIYGLCKALRNCTNHLDADAVYATIVLRLKELVEATDGDIDVIGFCIAYSTNCFKLTASFEN